uniref:U36-Liphistoxin-Lth1b_1 n=1 Tax=Liphistius thaleban TaxID=1905330 RepID=A0A4Q8K430_9ARAC
MTMPTAQLLWLTLLGAIQNGELDCIVENISCPCGTSRSTVQLSNRLSCNGSSMNEDPCFGFQNCKTCRMGLDRCLTCPEGKSGSFCNEISECGNAKQLTRRIANGDMTNEGDWPWHVGLSRYNGRDWSIYCGGVLISSTTVITAAHCLPSRREEDYHLYFGKYYFRLDEDDEEVEMRTPSRLIIHPRYNISAPLDADIAVIRFSPPVPFTDRIRPICLPTAVSSRKNLVHGNKGWVREMLH